MLENGVTFAACQRLMAAGVPGRSVAVLGAVLAIGQARVTLSRDGRLFEIGGPDGRLLIACFDGGVLCDVAAVSLASPDCFALATGDGWALGEPALEQAERAALAGRSVRLRVFDDAKQWLAAAGEGIVVIDWAAALPRLRMLGERVTLECSPAMGFAIEQRLRCGGLPRVAKAAPDSAALREAAREMEGELV